MEEWKKIPNHEHYEISNFGNVRSLKWGKVQELKKSVNEKGYEYVRCDGKHCRISRLVGLVFIPNPENKAEIDHIDRNRTNNHYTNLRWASRAEQLENRAERKAPKSGHRHIVKRDDGYTVEVWRNSARHYVGYYKELPEAIKARDDYLNN